MGQMATMIRSCGCCGMFFGFNFDRAPRVEVNGKLEPVCRECVDEANRRWRAQGLPEFQIHPQAYAPIKARGFEGWNGKSPRRDPSLRLVK